MKIDQHDAWKSITALCCAGGERHPSDTPDLRAAILAELLGRFVLDPTPRPILDVLAETYRRHDKTMAEAGFAICMAIRVLVYSGLLGCNTIDPTDNSPVFRDDTIIAGATPLVVYAAAEDAPAKAH